jgi:GntR family transcriptional repressor for pyruvate dehydrogenase complex
MTSDTPRRHIAPRQTLSQAVSSAIIERIRSGEFSPGDRLPTEKGFMEEYGVGRNAVREAVQTLVTLGLVDVRPGRGATVRGIESATALDPEVLGRLLTEEAVDDLYAFRLLLEPEIARCAAEKATDTDLAAIEARLRAFHFAHAEGAPVSDVDDALHAAIARASHNSVYDTVLTAVSGLIANARRLTEGVPWATARAAAEHEEIVAAIRAGDAPAAQQAMRRHIEGAAEAIQAGRQRGS